MPMSSSRSSRSSLSSAGLRIEFPVEFQERLKDRDPDVLGALFDACFPVLWRTMRRSVQDQATAEDLVQETMLSVYHRLDRYDPSRPVGPWVVTIAANKLRDHWRRDSYRESFRVPEESLEEDARSDPSLGLPASASPEVEQYLESALLNLPKNARRIIELRYQLGWSFDEIAATLQITVVTARKRLSRALQTMRMSVPPCGVR